MTINMFSTTKVAAHRIFNRLGFDIVGLENSHSDLSKHLASIFRAKGVDCVIDVGANLGQYGTLLRETGYKGHIVSFEPVSSVFESLKEKCRRDEKWHCHKLALGEKNENRFINVYKSADFSSFLTANDYSKNIWQSLDVAVPESVTVVRLEDVFGDLVERLGAKNCMLKLDTQGYDKSVLEGAKGCLHQICVLQSELSLIPIYDGMPEAYDLLKTFRDNDFYISGMYPVNRDKTMAVIEYDCVLVKRDFGSVM
jgi:FkbM family methyltransferase